MWIVGKNNDCMVNADHVIKIFVTKDGAVKADFMNGAGTQLCRYDSEAAAETAVDMAASAAGRGSTVIRLPSDEAVRAEIINANMGDRPRSADGHKGRRRGGS